MLRIKKSLEITENEKKRNMGGCINLLHPEVQGGSSGKTDGERKERDDQGEESSFTMLDGGREKKGQLVGCNTPKAMT